MDSERGLEAAGPAVDDEAASAPAVQMQALTGGQRDYTDGRKRWDWDSHFPIEARRLMNAEASLLIAMLLVSLIAAGAFLGLSDQSSWIAIGELRLWINFRLLTTFFAGWVGGTTFSIKWLIHAAAKGKWHRDRRYWRLMVPLIGGVYACVVVTLFASGMLLREPGHEDVATTTALAFMVGYFSDGVSGLLSNVANAVFGTLEKK